MSTDSASRGAPGSPWLYGPGWDLGLGAGVAYLISVPLIMLLPFAQGASGWPIWAVWIIAIGINGAHYGATFLRVYEQREQRRKYALFAVWLTIALCAVFVIGVYDAWVGSALVTLYLTWSPWHFAGQNYGISLMFLRRSGVRVEDRVKRLLYGSFVLSFLLAFLALHVEGANNVFAPTRTFNTPTLDLLRLGIPRAVAVPLTLATAAAYLGCLAGVFVYLARASRIRTLVPVASIVVCQALWFVLPALHDIGGIGTGRGLAFSAIWISAAHSLQYLWVTNYYEEREGRTAGTSTYLVKTVLAGNAAFVIPGVLFASHLLGTRSWDAGLGILIFSVVNIHHFFLDGAIWKLRDGAVARALLRVSEPPGERVRAERSAASRRRSQMLWAIFALCLLVELGDLVQKQAEAMGAAAVSSSVLDRMALVGRDHEGMRIRLGRAALRQKDFDRAQHQFERSIAARPTIAAYAGVGRALEGRGDLRGAALSYDEGLALAPDDAELLRSAGRIRLELGEPHRAAALLGRALEIEPNHPGVAQMLGRAQRRITE